MAEERFWIDPEAQEFYIEVKEFLGKHLYSLRQEDGVKYSRYAAILEKSRRMREVVGESACGYICGALSEVEDVNVYTIPAIREMFMNVLRKYEVYFGITGGSVLLPDLDGAHLPCITKVNFGKTYLGNANGAPSYPYSGLRFGTQSRILFCLPLSLPGGDPVWCTFICDWGSKANYISGRVMRFLGIDETETSHFNVCIGTVNTTAFPSSLEPRLGELNLIGDDYLSAADSMLVLEYQGGRWRPRIDSIPPQTS